MSQLYSKLLGTGSYLPEKILTNVDLEKIVDTSDSWIEERTGIKARHIVAENETASSMAENAARRALDAADISPNDLDMIIVATTTPDRTFPGASCLLQERLGITNLCPSFDLNSTACAGFVYALSVADQYVKSGMAKHILVVGTEAMSRVLDWNDRTTCVLFGDGAGAFVLGASKEPGIVTTCLHSDGMHKDILYLPNSFGNNGHNDACFLQMEGNPVFKVAVKRLGELFDQTLDAAGMQRSDVDWLVPHQANIRIIASMAKKLNLSLEQVALTIANHGNTSSASIPLAFDEYVKQGKIKRGQNILLEGFGGGLAWGSALLKY